MNFLLNEFSIDFSCCQGLCGFAVSFSSLTTRKIDVLVCKQKIQKCKQRSEKSHLNIGSVFCYSGVNGASFFQFLFGKSICSSILTSTPTGEIFLSVIFMVVFIYWMRQCCGWVLTSVWIVYSVWVT